jgi:rod shape-determining protein MreD
VRPAFERWARAGLPVSAILCATIAMAAPIPLPGIVVPDVVLMLVFLSAAFRSDAFPVWLCFAMGLLVDLVGSTPPGAHAMTFVTCHAFAVSQRRYFKLVGLLWIGFALVAAWTGLAMWGVMSAYYGIWLDPRPLLVQAFISILVFPIISSSLQRLTGGSSASGVHA